MAPPAVHPDALITSSAVAASGLHSTSQINGTHACVDDGQEMMSIYEKKSQPNANHIYLVVNVFLAILYSPSFKYKYYIRQIFETVFIIINLFRL